MKQFVVAGLFATMSLSAMATDQSVIDHFNKACTICHGNPGIPAAPKAFDAEAWKPRLAKGIDALLHSVKNGFNAMPPGGMCTDCTDADYKALIKYMSTPKK